MIHQRDVVLNRDILESKKFTRDYVKKIEVFNYHVEVTFNMVFSLGKYIDFPYKFITNREVIYC